MLSRLAIEADEAPIAAMMPAAVAESFPYLTFSPERWRETFRSYLENADLVFFVVEERREVLGFSVVSWGPNAFSDSLFAEQRLIYVKPDKRGTRAAAELVTAFTQWADRLGIKDVDIQLTNGRKPEQAERYLRRFGFETVGATLRKRRA